MAQTDGREGHKAPQSDRTRGARLEVEVLHFLGASGIYTTRELAEGLGRDRGAVYRACVRLRDRGVLRLSRIPKRLYRFRLTGEILHRINFPVVTRLIARVGAVHRRGQSPRNHLSRIFAGLRADPELQEPSRQRCIERFEKAARAVTTDEELVQLTALLPFVTGVIRWWPQALEHEYEMPVRRVAEQLDRPQIKRLKEEFPNLYRAGEATLDRKAPIHAEEVEAIAVQILANYMDVIEQLESSGAHDLLVERDTELARLGSPETTPREDLDVVGGRVLDERLSEARAVSADEQTPRQVALIQLSPKALVEIVREALSPSGGGQKSPRRRKGPRWWLLNLVGLAASGCIAAGDFWLALMAVLTGTLPSVVLTDIGAAIAVASSLHTGAQSAVATLSKMADEIET